MHYEDAFSCCIKFTTYLYNFALGKGDYKIKYFLIGIVRAIKSID